MTVTSYSSESLLVQFAVYIILWVVYAGICTAEFLCLRGLFLLDISMLVNKLWGNNPYPTAFPYGNGMVLHLYQQQESSMTKTVHKVINKGLKTYV